LIDKAEFPRLSALGRTDDRMLCGVKVLCGVSVRGIIATADVAAFQTFPQVDPCRADLEAIFAAVRAGFDIVDVIEVGAYWILHGDPPKYCFDAHPFRVGT
jgi:hypothetical protein